MKKTILFVLVIALFGVFVGGCSAPAEGDAAKKPDAPKTETK
ncbi:MAG: hypothetical protein ABUL49_00385 [bacterium]